REGRAADRHGALAAEAGGRAGPTARLVGRLRKPHGQRGEVAVIPLVENPGAVFVPKARLYVVTAEREVVGGPVGGARRRGWAGGRRAVADYRAGGGAGMGRRPGPCFEAVEGRRAGPPIVLLSARGRPFGHRDAVRFAVGRELTLLCGHYKDVDQRVADGLGAEELSLGDFVLSGGEPAALCVIDAVVRLLPGALGDHESAATDSHYDGLLAPP